MPMPARTMSSRAAGDPSAPAVFEACSTAGTTPSAASAPTNPSRRAVCSAV